MAGWTIAVDYVVFLVFIVGSTLWPLYDRKKAPGTKAGYVFASGAGMAAMMLSIARGTLGVRSFLGFPSELFYRGSAMWETLYGMLCAYPIVAYVFVPVYFSLGITSVYQYLDLRFKSRTVRCLASATYILRQVLNLGVTVFTPCVALNTVIGVPYWVSILGITAISIMFTIFGGLKAAIKADVIQGITMILISLAIIIQCCIEVGGVSPVLTVPRDDGRLKFFDFKWDFTVRVDTMSAWVGQLFMSVSLFGCQQNFVQRYVSMKSEKKVKQALMTNVPAITVLFSLSWVAGMGIYATYADCDPLTTGYIKKMDEIMPFFVVDKFAYMPGLLGLFMGSLFNGALSLSVSNLNSLATVTWEDFLSHAPAFRDMKDSQQLIIIKILGAIYGVIIMGISFGVGLLSGVIESSMLMTSATSGPLLGVFLLAMIVPCCTRKGAIAGMITSHVLTLWVMVGHLMAENKAIEMLPLSVEGCTNTTFSSHLVKPSQEWLLPTTPLEVNLNTTHFLDQFNHLDSKHATPVESSNPFQPLYLMTYMYYALFGTVITVVVGIVVSLIFKTDESDLYDEKLLHPMVLKLSKMCPGKPRRFLKTDDKSRNLNGPANGKQDSIKECDNHGFDILDGMHCVEIESHKIEPTLNGNKSNGIYRIENHENHNEKFRNFTEEEMNKPQVTRF